MKTESLGALVKITKGKKYDETLDSDLRYIQIEDLRSNDNLKYCKRIANQVVCNAEDILIAWDGANAGTIGFGLEGAIGSTIAKLQIIKGDIDTNYLGKFLQSKFNYLRERCTGATIPHISKQVLCSIKIPLPPLPEQQRIAAILDAADSLRKKTQQIIDSYDELAQSVFLDMFGDPVANPKGWKEKKLKEICIKITDGTHFSPKPQKNGFPYVTAKHVKEHGLDFYSRPTYISEEAHYEIFKRCSPEYGDILYIKDGATTGIACINTFKEPISLLSSLALLKPHKEILNNNFLCFWLNHKGIRKKLISEYMSGAAIQRYTLVKINMFRIALPPISLQTQFAQKIELIEKQKDLAKQSLKESEDLFQSLLQKAFKGELNN